MIRAHLMRHAMRLSKELMQKRLTARRLTVFLTLKSFDPQAVTAELPYSSADYFMLMDEAGRALDKLFDPERIYRACGLVATDIAVRQSGDFDLFRRAEQQHEDKHLQLLQAMHRINHKYGDNMLSVCGAFKSGSRAAGTRFNYPMLECG